MIESNQIRSPRLRHLAVVQPGGTADPTAEPGSDWAAIAADFAGCGVRPEDFPCPPGWSAAEYWEMRAALTTAEISQAMTVLPSPGPRLSLVPEPEAEAGL